MNHKTLEILRNVVGGIGNAISFFLFASPVPTFIGIYKKKSVEQFKPDPYLATIMNCILWVFYGLPFVHPNSTLVVTTNAIGLAIELTYIVIFLLYSDKKGRLKVVAWIAVEIVFLAIVASCTLKIFHTTKKRSNVAGILCVIFGLLMYISPLTIMGKVIKTKSVKYMPFYLSVGNFANGLIWTIYAVIPPGPDPYIIIPNGLGALSGAVQLILYAYYSKFTPKDDEKKPTELQMVGPAP
ncbi:hypothetical protein Ancab_001545 [Ancistrocladus abbreviatus]